MAPEERLRAAKARTVGLKQTLKAVERGLARVVFVARDAEERVVAGLVQQAQAKNIPLVWVDSMAWLGRVCKIEVGASAVAITEE